MRCLLGNGGSVLCELDAGTNFEILAERGCEKQQAATQAVVFSALLFGVAPDQYFPPACPRRIKLDGEQRLLVSEVWVRERV